MISVHFEGDPYVTLMWIKSPFLEQGDTASKKCKNKYITAKRWWKAKKKKTKKSKAKPTSAGRAKASSAESTLAPCAHLRMQTFSGPRDNGEPSRYCCDCGEAV